MKRIQLPKIIVTINEIVLAGFIFKLATFKKIYKFLSLITYRNFPKMYVNSTVNQKRTRSADLSSVLNI